MNAYGKGAGILSEAQILIDDLLDDNLAGPGGDRLGDLLRTRQEVRRLYVLQLHLWSGLMPYVIEADERGGVPPPEQTTRRLRGSADDLQQPNELTQTLAGDRTLHHQAGGKQRLGTYGLAAAVGIALLIGAIVWRWVASRPVGTIAAAVDARWNDGSDATVGAPVQVRPWTLSAGIVELKLRNGVSVVMEAPAQFTLLSPARILLEGGRLSALVPPAARGFTVQANGAEFVDLGTEFAVEVRPGYPTHAEVFRGLVQAKLLDLSNQVIASQNVAASQAVELRQGGGVIMTGTRRPLAFARAGRVNQHRRMSPVRLAADETSSPSTQPASADIKYVGTAKDTPNAAEVTHWRTASVKKSKDVTGGNAYGASLGVVNWQNGSAGEQDKGSSTFGWAFVDCGGQFSKDGYVKLDDVKDAATSVNAGIALDHFQFELTGTAADYDGKKIRIGVMEGCLTKDELADDTFKGLQIAKTGGTGAGSQSDVQAVRNGAAASGTPEIYFFELSNVKPGDTFDIKAVKDVGGTSGAGGYIGPVFWDVTKTEGGQK